MESTLEGSLEILFQERKLFKREKWKKQFFKMDKHRKVLEQKNFSTDTKIVDCYDISQVVVEEYSKPLSMTIFVFSEKEKKSKSITLCAYSTIDFKKWKNSLEEIAPNPSKPLLSNTQLNLEKRSSFLSSNNCDEASPLPTRTNSIANVFCTNKTTSKLEIRHIEEWSMYDVQELLNCIRAENEDHSSRPRKTMLELYGNDFLSNDIDGITLEMLTEQSLETIGVKCSLHRQKLFQTIESLKISRKYSLQNHYFLKKLEWSKVNVWNTITDAQEEQLCKLVDKEYILQHYLELDYSQYQNFRSKEEGIHVVTGTHHFSLEGQQHPFSIKLRLINTKHSDEFKSIDHILSPFCSSVPSIRSDVHLYAAGEIIAVLLVGPFLLEWSSSCVLVPKKICQTMQCMLLDYYTDLYQDYEISIPEQQINPLLSKLAEFVAEWNATKLYTSYKVPVEMGTKYNCIDFVEECLQYLNLSFPSVWTKNSGLLYTIFNPMETILKELRTNGKLETLIYKPSAALSKQICLSVPSKMLLQDETIHFSSLEEVLQVLDAHFLQETQRQEYFIDYYLLKSYCTCFWLLQFSNGKAYYLIDERKDHPLKKGHMS